MKKSKRNGLAGNPARPTASGNTSSDEDHDAASDEGVRGLLSSGDLSPWTPSATQFIRSNAGFPGAPPGAWVGKRPLGEGGYGMAGLWEKLDGDGNVVDVSEPVKRTVRDDHG